MEASSNTVLAKTPRRGSASRGSSAPRLPCYEALLKRCGRIIDVLVEAMLTKGPRLAAAYKRPLEETDVFFCKGYPHDQEQRDCNPCDRGQAVGRPARTPPCAEIHCGLIASGDTVIKSAAKRDEKVATLGDVLCFEMEAAGAMSEYPCIVIRGISDYADSHKNDQWHHYAAATAAACTQEPLSFLAPRAPSGSGANASMSTATGKSNQQGARSTFHGNGLQQTGSGSISFGRGAHVRFGGEG